MPAHLSGVWGTAESLWAGTEAQFELQLQLDGFGAFAGSTKPMTRTDGKPDQARPPRVILGLPFRATLDGDVLTVQPFMPPGSAGPGDKGPSPQEMTITCRYGAQEQTLRCSGAKLVETVMKRRSETVSAEVTEGLKRMRAQLAGNAG